MTIFLEASEDTISSFSPLKIKIGRFSSSNLFWISFQLWWITCACPALNSPCLFYKSGLFLLLTISSLVEADSSSFRVLQFGQIFFYIFTNGILKSVAIAVFIPANGSRPINPENKL